MRDIVRLLSVAIVLLCLCACGRTTVAPSASPSVEATTGASAAPSPASALGTENSANPSDESTAPPSSEPPHVAQTDTAAGPCRIGMVLVPGATFRMGVRPPRTEEPYAVQYALVTLDSFCINRTEVTAGAYGRCLRSGACTLGTLTSPDEVCSNVNDPDAANFPMTCVTWAEADQFCRANESRLPTEAEWEYAARGSDGRLYPWGSQVPGPTLLNGYGMEAWGVYGDSTDSHDRPIVLYNANDGWHGVAPVGSFPAGASPFGLLDMAGNVEEWVADCDEFAAANPPAVTNPTGPNRAHCGHVARGGGFLSARARDVQAVARGGGPEERRFPLGLRCAAAPDSGSTLAH